VAGKMAALPATNHVLDPWPSMVGTACHAYAADAFTEDNLRSGLLRWVAEQKVTPHPEHPGTADLYDASEQAVVDHKFLGPSLDGQGPQGPAPQVRRPAAALRPRLLLMGLPVKRVVLAAYPRTAATLDGLYVWETRLHRLAAGTLSCPTSSTLLRPGARRHPPAASDGRPDPAGRAPLTDIPAVPDADECYFCPFYRPQAARDNGPGCPRPDDRPGLRIGLLTSTSQCSTSPSTPTPASGSVAPASSCAGCARAGGCR
jgi:hypothetical protein